MLCKDLLPSTIQKNVWDNIINSGEEKKKGTSEKKKGEIHINTDIDLKTNLNRLRVYSLFVVVSSILSLLLCCAEPITLGTVVEISLFHFLKKMFSWFMLCLSVYFTIARVFG